MVQAFLLIALEMIVEKGSYVSMAAPPSVQWDLPVFKIPQIKLRVL